MKLWLGILWANDLDERNIWCYNAAGSVAKVSVSGVSMSDFKGSEKRKYVRVPFSFVLRYRAMHGAMTEAPKVFTASATRNVSVGGVLFPATTNIPLGTELELELNFSAIPHASEKDTLTKYRSVRVSGRVVRTEEIIKGELYNVGFVIEKIDEKERHAMEQFIDFFLRRERLRNKLKFGIAGKNYIGPERRKFVRVPYTFIVKYAPSGHPYGKSEEPHYCLNANISACGILMETHEKFELSSLLELELVIPGDKEVIPIKVTGRVIRTEELLENELYETGVAFEKVDKKDQAALYHFLTHFQKTHKKPA